MGPGEVTATHSATNVITGSQSGNRSVTTAKSINLFQMGKAAASSSREHGFEGNTVSESAR